MSDLLPATVTLTLEMAVGLTTPNTRQVLSRVSVGIDVTTQGGVNQIQKTLAESGGSLTITGITTGVMVETDTNTEVTATLVSGSSSLLTTVNRVLVFMGALTSLTLDNVDTGSTHAVRVIYC